MLGRGLAIDPSPPTGLLLESPSHEFDLIGDWGTESGAGRPWKGSLADNPVVPRSP